MKNAPERRGDPQRQSTEAGAPLQNFTAADQSRNSLRLSQHQKVEDGAKTNQEKGGEVYLGSEIHKAAQNFEKNENKRKKNREKTENRKFQASGSSS